MRLQKAHTCMEITRGDTFGVEQLAHIGEILLLMEFWDGGAREGCVFVEKRDTDFVLWEYIYPYFTHDAEVRKYKLGNNSRVEQIVKEIEGFCNRQYDGVEIFDFTDLYKKENLRQFFAMDT